MALGVLLFTAISKPKNYGFDTNINSFFIGFFILFPPKPPYFSTPCKRGCTWTNMEAFMTDPKNNRFHTDGRFQLFLTSYVCT